MPITKNRTVVPFHGRTNGGQNLRNFPRNSVLYGGLDSVVYIPIPKHSVTLGTSLALNTPINPGDIMIDDGTSGQAWTTPYTSVPRNVVVSFATAAGANTEFTVRVSGYDQFDRLAEEEITVTDDETNSGGFIAFKEVLQVELVRKSASATGVVDIIISSVFAHNDTSHDFSGDLSAPGLRIGLPFIPDRPGLISAVVIIQSAAVVGYTRRTSDNLWEVQNSVASVGDATDLTDADVYGDISNGTILCPATSASSGWIAVHLDRDLARATL